MSEMEHKKVKLVKVLDGWHTPVNIQLWLEDSWGVYCPLSLDQKDAYEVLKYYFEDQDWTCTYYLFDDELYEIESERTLDICGYVEAEVKDMGIEVDAFWYSGEASLRECAERALKNLEENS